MKNLKAQAVKAKNKRVEMPTKEKVAGMCLLATVCPAYCEINGNTAMQKFLKTMFYITVFVGIVLIAVVRCFVH